MDDRERKRYIEEIFKLCRTDSILIINSHNQLIRLNVPFTVLVVVDGLPGLSIEDLGSVTGIKMDVKLIDIYVVNGRFYYYYNFVVCKEET